jgi:hypothetical protein
MDLRRRLMAHPREAASIMTRPFRFVHSVLLLAAVAVTSACSSSPAGPTPVRAGLWGGDHIALTVAGMGAHIEFDCAHGDIPVSLMVNARNEFDVSGTFVREHGGPIRVGEVPDSHPATYAGSVTETTMVLTVRLTDTNEVIGTFALSRDSSGRVLKCLSLVP